MRMILLLGALAILGLPAAGVTAQDSNESGPSVGPLDQSRALAYSQAVVGRTLGDYRFRDRQGRTLMLSELAGRPLVFSLIYTSCYHTCPMVTSHLAKVVEVARDALGQDSFSVVTVGFDAPVDTPDRMRIFAAQRHIDDPDWYFLSSDAETIERFSQDLGFLYVSSPKGFDHLVQSTIVDAEGKIYRQVYGEIFLAPLLVEPLKELLYGKAVATSVVDGLMNNIRLVCTVYDPTTGLYHFDYSLFVGIGAGLLSLGTIAVFIAHAWRSSKPPVKRT
jgi:protein SCO1/2